MKKILLIAIVLVLVLEGVYAQGFKLGHKAKNFSLKNINNKKVTLFRYPDAKKGVVLIFTSNHCPNAIAYEERIIEIDKEFRKEGYPVIAINSNDYRIHAKESFKELKKKAKEKKFTFPYLRDNKQVVYKMYGARRTPHVFLLNKKGRDFVIAYMGAIDDNINPNAVKKEYLKDAINALLKNEAPNPSYTKAKGCDIYDKNYGK